MRLNLNFISEYLNTYRYNLNISEKYKNDRSYVEELISFHKRKTVVNALESLLLIGSSLLSGFETQMLSGSHPGHELMGLASLTFFGLFGFPAYLTAKHVRFTEMAENLPIVD